MCVEIVLFVINAQNLAQRYFKGYLSISDKKTISNIFPLATVARQPVFVSNANYNPENLAKIICYIYVMNRSRTNCIIIVLLLHGIIMDWNWEGGFGCPAGLWSIVFTVRGSCDQQWITVGGNCIKETSMYIRQDQSLGSVYR